MTDGGYDIDPYEGAGEEFQPGREGRERDDMEEEREITEERERNERQGARRKTKKDGGKTYTRLEDRGEEIELRELSDAVIDVKIGKGKKIPANVGEAAQERVTELLDGIFEKVQYRKILLAVSELDGKYMIYSTDKGSNYYALDYDGNFEDGKEHKKLSEALGQRLIERASDLDDQISQETQRRTTTTSRERETGQREEENQIEEEEEDQGTMGERLERIEAEREGIIERMSLREKVKYYFKKYGFTVVGILTAIGAVIGSILSNLKTGLAKVAKGVGKGLKDLGAKLAGILPGMIGAIAKFLFDTAGEAVGFLAEHAWVLIVGLVVLVVESLKKKVERKK